MTGGDSRLYPVLESARRLVAKMEEIHEHPRFKAVWECAHFRIGAYDGPTYVNELAAVKAALSRDDAQGKPDRDKLATMLKANGFTSRDGTYLQGGTYGVIDAVLSALSSPQRES